MIPLNARRKCRRPNVVPSVALVGYSILTASPPTLAAHHAGDLVTAFRGRTASSTNTVTSPWADIVAPFSDAGAGQCSFQAAAAVAPDDDSIVYPMSGNGIHGYAQWRRAVLGAQVAQQNGGSGTLITVPDLTGLAEGSWIMGMVYSRAQQATADLQACIPAGCVERRRSNTGATNNLVVFDSGGPIVGGSFTGVAFTVADETTGWCAVVCEIALG